IMYSTCPPPQRITHWRRATNPATAECRMSGCIHDSSRWIAFFNSDRLDGRDRYSRDFNHALSPESADVRSGDKNAMETCNAY
ncbi:hypothetical protein NPIL_684701, partial [Nephila pilipes]